MWLGMLPGPIAPKDDVTMWWNWVDIVPNVPKCPVPGWCCVDLTEVSGTGTDVVPTCIPVPPLPVLLSCRTYRSVRYRY